MERAPSQFGRRLLATLLLVSCVGCDQATKRFATVQLCGAPPRTYFHDSLRLEYALNPGGFLSIGDDLPPHFRFGFFIVTNIAMLCGVGVVLLKRRECRLATYVACSCLFAGGVGNLIDRFLNRGLVTDFIFLQFGRLHTGIFNIADVAITIGVLLLMASISAPAGSRLPAG